MEEFNIFFLFKKDINGCEAPSLRKEERVIIYIYIYIAYDSNGKKSRKAFYVKTGMWKTLT